MNIKKMLSLFLVVVLSFTFATGCSKTPTKGAAEKVELLISAAASMTDVLEELKGAYKEIDPNATLTFTLGSSGTLQTQIEEGAPADIFMSAAQKQMLALEEKGLILDGTKKTLLVNKVVLIAPLESTSSVKSFGELTSADVKNIALGDPSNVPVGQYSEEIFTSLSILDEVKAKAVYGSDVRTVLTWVENNEADFGVVYATDAMSSDKIQIVAEAPEDSHKEVSYPVAVIKESKNAESAKAFLDFLSTDQAIKIFEKHGFSMK